MSYSKMDRVFPVLSQEKTAHIISEILKGMYGGKRSSVKAIAAVMPADLRSIKSWYGGQNVPNLSHFLQLCMSAPEFLAAILKIMGYSDLARHLIQTEKRRKALKVVPTIEVYSINFDTIGSADVLDVVRQLSIRQVWFYSQLKKGRRYGADDIVDFWAVGQATAKRDIADLSRLGLIRYIGSKRKGYYIVQQSEM